MSRVAEQRGRVHGEGQADGHPVGVARTEEVDGRVPGEPQHAPVVRAEVADELRALAKES
ncbi:hypothetical protein [Streptomyces sp. NPDC015350]|uniref:hypothetical protein n=1 Tax=Streptomyces sp. NPDC015350 TaxID=3364955 RepID=UPI003700E831